MDARTQLTQSAKDLQRAADQERATMSTVKKQLDQVKTGVQVAHNHGLNLGGTETQMHALERQVKDMQKGIENLERQCRDMNKQASAL